MRLLPAPFQAVGALNSLLVAVQDHVAVLVSSCQMPPAPSYRWPPAAPYLDIIPAVQSLLFLINEQSRVYIDALTRTLADMLCWLLVHQGNSALHAGAGRLLLACCIASPHEHLLPVRYTLVLGTCICHLEMPICAWIHWPADAKPLPCQHPCRGPPQPSGPSQSCEPVKRLLQRLVPSLFLDMLLKAWGAW